MTGMCGGAVSSVLTVALREGRDPSPPRGNQTIVNSRHTCRDTPGGQRDDCEDAVPRKQSETHTKNIYICNKIIRANLSV